MKCEHTHIQVKPTVSVVHVQLMAPSQYSVYLSLFLYLCGLLSCVRCSLQEGKCSLLTCLAMHHTTGFICFKLSCKLFLNSIKQGQVCYVCFIYSKFFTNEQFCI